MYTVAAKGNRHIQRYATSVVRWFTKKHSVWGFFGKHSRGLPVDQVHGYSEGISPVLGRHIGLVNEGQAGFENMSMFSLSNTIVFRGMRW